MKKQKVIIIGAGAAGLAAASELVKLGIPADELIILEAQSRIGGRIHTIVVGKTIAKSIFLVFLKVLIIF